MADQAYKIAIAANFTIEPIESSLSEGLTRLGVPFEIEFAPYNQIFQQLADPSSLFNTNSTGANAIFLRIVDLVDNSTAISALSENDITGIQNAASELSDWLQKPRSNSKPLFVVLTPSSTGTASSSVTEALNEIEAGFAASLQDVSNLLVVGTDQFPERYRVGEFENAKGLELGRVPYKPFYYDALGWELCRKIDAARRAPFKVIVLDCDNTLWDGVCGEDGIHGVTLSESRRFLQEFVLRQRATGMVLALCSKNNEADVWELFDARHDMVLKREHVSAWRINWNPKSVNLMELSDELGLGLDSFIFIDDDAAVCAEVRENCPSVLTVQLPEDTSEIPRLFEHLWCFDKLKVTEEDALRAESYRHQTERSKLRDASADFASFLQNLQLQCDVEEMRDDQIPRVSQLSLRTNQFNSTTIRRSEAEIAEIASDPLRSIWTVTVRDRFGDYGLVGVITFMTQDESLVVDSFMLSCRVLGRGVEHSVIRALGRKAVELSVPEIVIEYSQSGKNLPLLAFLESISPLSELTDDRVGRVSLSAQQALDLDPVLTAQTTSPVTAAPAESPKKAADTKGATHNRQIYIELAEYLSQDQRQIVDYSDLDRETLSTEHCPPSTVTESSLALIWEQLLARKGIGVDDNFFEIGGDSLLGVTLFVEIEEQFERSLPLTTLVTSPTIREMASAIDNISDERQWEYLVPIQPNGSKDPLFCMHAAGGNVLFYRDLANALGPDQPVYGLQARGVADRSKTAHDSVEEMAAEYLSEIRKIKKRGPYRLCGSSFGGLVAFEAARQLKRSGEAVEFLGLFDTYGPGYLKSLERSNSQSKIRLTAERAVSLKNQLAEIGSIREQFRFAKTKFSKLIMRSKRKRIWQKNQFELEYAKKTGLELPMDILRNHKAIDHALNTYQPSVYDGRVALFRADQQPSGSDPYLGWGKYVSGKIAATEVKGSHGALTVYPFAEHLAEKVKPYLGDDDQLSATHLNN